MIIPVSASVMKNLTLGSTALPPSVIEPFIENLNWSSLGPSRFIRICGMFMSWLIIRLNLVFVVIWLRDELCNRICDLWGGLER